MHSTSNSVLKIRAAELPVLKLTQLKKMLTAAQNRAADAEKIGWPALANSWKYDAEQVQAEIAARKLS